MAGRKLEYIVEQSLHSMQNQQWRVLDISWTEHGEVFVRRGVIDRQQEPRDHSQEKDAVMVWPAPRRSCHGCSARFVDMSQNENQASAKVGLKPSNRFSWRHILVEDKAGRKDSHHLPRSSNSQFTTPPHFL